MTLKLSDLVVLLVEPSSTQRKIITKDLDTLGIKLVTTMASGQEALDTMKTFSPDLVISALYLPDMSGTDLVQNMRSDQELQGTAFMLISSETRFRYLDPIRQAGIIAILPKPFDVGDLKIALHNTLEHLDPEHLRLEDFDPETLRVLIVDDSAFARKHIKRVLGGMGMDVANFTEANDGVEAAKSVSENYFDLIITDYNMPNMDGHELVDYIRKNSCQSSVPVLMVTSEENESRLAAVQQSGVSAICDKPFEQNSIRELIEQVFSNM